MALFCSLQEKDVMKGELCYYLLIGMALGACRRKTYFCFSFSLVAYGQAFAALFSHTPSPPSGGRKGGDNRVSHFWII